VRAARHCRHAPLVFAAHHARLALHQLQQDPQSNYVARLVFPDHVREFRVEVDLVAEMSVYSPSIFFLKPSANRFPFATGRRLAGSRFLGAEPSRRSSSLT
jgi:hypothetical protein